MLEAQHTVRPQQLRKRAEAPEQVIMFCARRSRHEQHGPGTTPKRPSRAGRDPYDIAPENRNRPTRGTIIQRYLNQELQALTNRARTETKPTARARESAVCRQRRVPEAARQNRHDQRGREHCSRELCSGEQPREANRTSAEARQAQRPSRAAAERKRRSAVPNCQRRRKCARRIGRQLAHSDARENRVRSSPPGGSGGARTCRA